MAEGAEAGIVISRGWLAVTGTLMAGIMALGSWGVTQTASRAGQTVQLEQLERRIAAIEARSDAWRDSIETRLSAVSDRVARIEARLDSGAGLDQGRRRTELERPEDVPPLENAILRWRRP